MLAIFCGSANKLQMYLQWMGDWQRNRYKCKEGGGGETGQWIDGGRERKEDETKGHGAEEEGGGGHESWRLFIHELGESD